MRSPMRQMVSLVLGVAMVALPAVASPLVGPSVGTAEIFLTEGKRWLDLEEYRRAAELFLQANRADPARPETYLLLAHSYLGARLFPQACYAFEAYLKAAPNDTERMAARADLKRCKQQRDDAAVASGQRLPDFVLSQQFIPRRAAFDVALYKEKRLLGPNSASEILAGLISDGYLDIDLAPMAQQLYRAALASADELYRDALAGKMRPGSDLRTGKALYELTAETGAPRPDYRARTAYLEGLAELWERRFDTAEKLFAQASELDPQEPAYRLARVKAIDRAGDRKRAEEELEKELPEDSRTRLMRVARAAARSAAEGAAEVETLCFTLFGKSL